MFHIVIPEPADGLLERPLSEHPHAPEGVTTILQARSVECTVCRIYQCPRIPPLKDERDQFGQTVLDEPPLLIMPCRYIVDPVRDGFQHSAEPLRPFADRQRVRHVGHIQLQQVGQRLIRRLPFPVPLLQFRFGLIALSGARVACDQRLLIHPLGRQERFDRFG